MKKQLFSIIGALLIFSMSILSPFTVFAEGEDENPPPPQVMETPPPDPSVIPETTYEYEVLDPEVPIQIMGTAPPVTLPVFLEEQPDVMGNAQLVEQQQVIFSNGTFEFISVTTKNGNVFYIFIRHDLEEGEANVFFLNKVDELDLLALIYGDSNNSNSGAQNVPNNSNNSNKGNSSGQAVVPDEPITPQKQQGLLSGISTSTWVIIGVCIVGGIALFIYSSKGGKKKKPINSYDDDDYDEEPDTYVNEDEDD